MSQHNESIATIQGKHMIALAGRTENTLLETWEKGRASNITETTGERTRKQHNRDDRRKERASNITEKMPTAGMAF